MAPLLALVALAGLAPFLSAAGGSFCSESPGGGQTFAGLGNYAELVGDRGFPMAAGISLAWSLLSASVTMLVAYPLASSLHASRRLYAVAFPLLVAMWSVPVYIGAPLWRFLLHGAAGDSVFSRVTGIAVNLMDSPGAAFAASALVASWFRLPQATFILLAALGRSRSSLDDAARVDGAGPAALAFTLRLPAMKGTLGAVAALELVSAFKEFTVPFLMTAGGPPLKAGITDRTVVGATTTTELYLYDMFSGYADSGIVAAYAVVLSLAVAGLAVLGVTIRNRARRGPAKGGLRNATEAAPRRLSYVPGRAADFLYTASSWLLLGILALCLAALAYCVLWMAFSDLSVAFVDSFFPRFPTAANFYRIFAEDGLALSFLNTVLVAAMTAALIGFAAFPAAAWLADRTPGQAVAAFVALQALSSSGGIHSLVPLYDLWRRLGLLGGYAPVVLVYLYHAAPVAVFALSTFLRDEPRSFKDAARLEGMGRAGYLWKVQLPLALPALGASAMVAFLSAWNGFLAPLVFLDDDATYTIAVRLHAYVGSIASGSPQWNRFAAASIVNVLLVGVLFRRFKRPLGGSALADEAGD